MRNFDVSCQSKQFLYICSDEVVECVYCLILQRFYFLWPHYWNLGVIAVGKTLKKILVINTGIYWEHANHKKLRSLNLNRINFHVVSTTLGKLVTPTRRTDPPRRWTSGSATFCGLQVFSEMKADAHTIAPNAASAPHGTENNTSRYWSLTICLQTDFKFGT